MTRHQAMRGQSSAWCRSHARYSGGHARAQLDCYSLSGFVRPPVHADRAALKFVVRFFIVPLIMGVVCLLAGAWFLLG